MAKNIKQQKQPHYHNKIAELSQKFNLHRIRISHWPKQKMLHLSALSLSPSLSLVPESFASRKFALADKREQLKKTRKSSTNLTDLRHVVNANESL